MKQPRNRRLAALAKFLSLRQCCGFGVLSEETRWEWPKRKPSLDHDRPNKRSQ